MSKQVKKDQQYEPEPTGWDALILLGSFILFPVFLLLVIWKFIKTNHLNYRKGYNYSQLCNSLTGGYIFIVMYFFFVPYGQLEPTLRAGKAIALALALGIIAIVIVAVLYGLRLSANKRFYKLAQEYEGLVSGGHNSIEEIASRVHQPMTKVQADLQYLLHHKHFPNGIIHNGKVKLKTFVQSHHNHNMSEIHQVVDIHITSQEAEIPSAHHGPKSQECTGCGNKVMLNPHQSMPCEYCGLTLSYSQ